MKKILLVNKSFEIGGIQSSMINMANELSEHYEVHLFLYNPTGAMKERLNSKVKVLDSSWRLACLGMSLKAALQTRKVKIIAFRLFASAWSKLFSNKLPVNIAIRHQPKLEGYDLAIAYHQEQRKKSVVSGFARIVDRCVDAQTKVSWLHFDSKTIDLDSQFNAPFYQRMDKLVCVSESLMKNFAKVHTEMSGKMEYCYNFVPYEGIKNKSLLKQAIAYPANKFVCFSACRLAEEKALVRAIWSISDVLKKHKDVVWYIAGDGAERSNIEKAIKENDLQEYIYLIGAQNNPYPYMRNADLMLNVSYHEAAPMVFFESKALATPVFATCTASAKELLQDQVDSFICENSKEGIRDAFAYLMDNRELVYKAKDALNSYKASNDESLRKIKELLGE